MDQLPFTPFFDDQPMITDDPSDVRFDDWLEPGWAPEYYYDERTLAPQMGQGWSGSSAPQEVAPFDFDSTNTNKFIDDGLTTADPAHQQFDCRVVLWSTPDRNANVLPGPDQCSGMETFFDTSTEGNSLIPSDPSNLNKKEHGRLPPLTDVEYLASLPHSVLEELSKKAAQALAAKIQASKKSVKSAGESSLPVHEEKVSRNTARKPNTTNSVLRCEHPGCATTFRHKKDYNRHFRTKHEPNTKTFSCPVVDCPSGFGHKFPRADKLRDHLRGDKILNLAHSCVLPGCSEILKDRAGLIDHLGRHDYDTRNFNKKLLINYGFASDRFHGYLFARYICSIPNCPFGTNEKDVMDTHLAIHHDGPYCPCPIPSCEKISQDYDSAFTHLAREHDHETRHRFRKEIWSAGLLEDNYIFSCPACHKEIKGYWSSNIFSHCQKHDHQALFLVSDALVEAITFSVGSMSYRGGSEPITGDMIVPYLVLSVKEKRKLRTKADFEQAVKKMKAEIEHEKNTQLS